MIKEVIIVEGKDDIAAVKAALDCEVISTHGFGYGKKLINTLKSISKRRGIIIFTDPDYMGEKIRRDIASQIPEAKHAHLPRNKGIKNNNVGIENAKPEDIREAIKKVRPYEEEYEELWRLQDLVKYGLVGKEDSQKKRDKVGHILGIGHTNGKVFLKRLNSFKIGKEELEKALKAVY